jgi:YVTN family beta-propeller protein
MVEGIALSPDGKQLWVGSNQAHTVSVIDTRQWQVVDTLFSPGMPYRIAFAPDGERAVVTSPMAGLIRIFDVATRKEIAALPAAAGSPTDPGPVGVVMSADGTRAYVALQGINQVAVVDVRRGAVIAHLATGSGPDGIAHATR